MREGPRTASISDPSAATITCACGGRMDSRPCDHERGRTAPPDSRVHDGLVAAEVPPRLYRRLDDGGVDGRLGRLDPVQVDHLDVFETVSLQVGPDQLEHRLRALARYEAEVHLH